MTSSVMSVSLQAHHPEMGTLGAQQLAGRFEGACAAWCRHRPSWKWTTRPRTCPSTALIPPDAVLASSTTVSPVFTPRLAASPAPRTNAFGVLVRRRLPCDDGQIVDGRVLVGVDALADEGQGAVAMADQAIEGQARCDGTHSGQCVPGRRAGDSSGSRKAQRVGPAFLVVARPGDLDVPELVDGGHLPGSPSIPIRCSPPTASWR